MTDSDRPDRSEDRREEPRNAPEDRAPRAEGSGADDEDWFPAIQLPDWLEPREPEHLRHRLVADEEEGNPSGPMGSASTAGIQDEEEGHGILERGLPSAAMEPVLGDSVLEPDEGFSFVDRGPLPTQDTGQQWDFDGTEPDEGAAAIAPDDSPELRQVKKLASGLAKAVKATRLYPVDNPVCHRFAQDLITLFKETFAELEEVRLSVGKTKFFFRGEVVLDQPGREESVPGRFFWNGIREITFRDGLTPREVLDFLSLCRLHHETAEEGEDDLVTLFWQRQFEHVAYIAVDDILDLDNPDDPIPEEFGKEYMNFVDLEMHNLEDEEELHRASTEMAEQIRANLAREEVELFGVSGDDRKALLAELREEEAPKMLEDILAIILETLYLDTNEQSFIETVGVIANALAGLIEEGRLLVAAGLVRMLNELIEQRRDLTQEMLKALEEGLQYGWADASCDALVRHLNDSLIDVLVGLDDFVGLLPPEATAPLVKVLSKLENPRARKKMVESLTRRARAHVDVFLPYLQDSRSEMVRDVAFILGGTMSDKAVKPLKDALRHPDVSVRCQALASLTRLGAAKAGDALISALFDSDQRVRLAAARSLAQAGRVAVPTLIQVLDDDAFRDRDFQEKKALFRALGAAGGTDVIPFVEKFLKRKSFFRRGQNDELRACACEALGWAGGSRAEALLEAHVEDRSTMVRSAALAGLRRMAEGPGEEADRSAA